MDRIRSEKTHQLHHEQIKYTSSQILEEEDENEIVRIEQKIKLYKAIDTLPDQNRLIFKLSRFEGKTNQEIADQLQLSKRTVETHISNALKKIKSNILLISIIMIFSFL